MKSRANPRVIPDSNLYLACNIRRAESETVKVHLRVPSPLACAKLFKSIPPDSLSDIENNGAVGIAFAGNVVALAWYDTVLDLESMPQANENVMAFGERVFEELYEAGFSLEEVTQLAAAVISEWTKRNTKTAEVTQRADFFAATTGMTNSSPSMSASTSSEIPGDSTN